MKYLFLFIFLLEGAFSKAQVSIPVVNFGDEKYVLKQYEKQALDKDFIANAYTWSYTKQADTLVITVNTPNRIIRKLTFTNAINGCDFDQITYTSCDSCTQDAIKDIIEDKSMRWKKIDENKYLSKWFWKTELLVVYNTNGPSVLTFRCPKLEKAQYKRIYETGIYEPYIYLTHEGKDMDLFNKAYSATSHREYEKAVELYTKAIQLDSMDSDAYCNRGNAKVFLEWYEDAIRDCTKAIKLNPNDAIAYSNRGVARYNQQHYTEALRDFKMAVKLDPNNKKYKKDLKDAYKEAYE